MNKAPRRPSSPVQVPPELHGYPTVVSRLVEEVVNSFEKLEIVVHLSKIRRGTRSTEAVSLAVALSLERTRDAMAALSAAGIVRTLEPYGSGWWLDRNGRWSASVEALALMYAESRPSVIDLVSRTAFAVRQRAARES